MSLLRTFTRSIQEMQCSGDKVKLHEIVLGKKTFDQLAFEIMSRDVRSTTPSMKVAERFGGHLEIMGVVIRKHESHDK